MTLTTRTDWLTDDITDRLTAERNEAALTMAQTVHLQRQADTVRRWLRANTHLRRTWRNEWHAMMVADRHTSPTTLMVEAMLIVTARLSS